MTARRSPVQIKIISLILILGSAFGIALTALAFAFTRNWFAIIPSFLIADICYLGLFCVCFWIGLRLWSDAPGARKWATIIFVAQIPNFSVPGFIYEFQTFGFSVRFARALAVNFHFGSSITIFASPNITETILGINLVAVVAAIYLLWAHSTVRQNAVGPI